MFTLVFPKKKKNLATATHSPKTRRYRCNQTTLITVKIKNDVRYSSNLHVFFLLRNKHVHPTFIGYLYDGANGLRYAVDGRETGTEQPVGHLETDFVNIESYFLFSIRQHGRGYDRRRGLFLGQYLLVSTRRRCQKVVVFLKYAKKKKQTYLIILYFITYYIRDTRSCHHCRRGASGKIRYQHTHNTMYMCIYNIVIGKKKL